MIKQNIVRLVTGLLFLLMGIAGKAQQSRVVATTDQQVYISGERIWVSGKLIASNLLSTNEVTIFLLDRHSGIVSQQKTLSREGLFFIDIPVLQQTPSDNYVVAVATDHAFRVFIPVMIINPVIPPEKSSVPVSLPTAPDPQIKPLKISFPAKEWNARQEVAVSVAEPADDLDYFVSVSRHDVLSVYADSLFSGWSFAGEGQWSPSEGKGLHINAMVLDQSGRPVTDVPVLSGLLSNQADIGYGVSDQAGRLRITHPFHYTDPPLVFTSLSSQTGLKIVLEQGPDTLSLVLNLPPLELSERFESAISERVTASTVGQAYQADQKLRLLTGEVDTTDFYGKPDKRYILDNYTRFPDMQEIIQEFVPEVRVRKVSGKSMLQVVNLPFKAFFDQAALVLLDGIPVTDVDQLLSLDPLKIYSIDVVARKFFLGHLQAQGIVHYKSYKTDLAGYKLSPTQVVYDYKGLRLPVVPAYPANTSQRIPDFRNTIYCATPGVLRNGGFIFSTLDAKGIYKVSVCGVDDKGNLFGGKEEIVVK